MTYMPCVTIIYCEHVEENLSACVYSIDIKHQTNPEDNAKQIVTQVNLCAECYKRLESDVIHGLIRKAMKELGRNLKWRR